jgi:hypothetical protein
LYVQVRQALEPRVAASALLGVGHAEHLADENGLFDDLGDLRATFGGVVVEQRLPSDSSTSSARRQARLAASRMPELNPWPMNGGI